jgi:hypothetical protein
MHTPSKGLLAALLLLMVLGTANADIGQNFTKGGIAIMGQGSYVTDLGYVMSSTNTYNKWSLTIRPEIDFLFMDSTTLYLSPYFVSSRTTNDSLNNFGSTYYGADFGIVRYFVLAAGAQSGLVPAIGASIGLELDPGADGMSAGVSYTNKSMYTYLSLSATARLFYFINDAVAPYVNVVPQLWYTVNGVDGSGSPVILADDQRLWMSVGVYFGFSYWVPRAKMSLGSK